MLLLRGSRRNSSLRVRNCMFARQVHGFYGGGGSLGFCRRWQGMPSERRPERLQYGPSASSFLRMLGNDATPLIWRKTHVHGSSDASEEGSKFESDSGEVMDIGS